ncbi:MAG: hypothetical protein AAFR72_13410 [Pseudomonadota bacterium]
MNNPSGYDPKKSSNMAKFGSMFKSGSKLLSPPGEPHEPAALRETLGSPPGQQPEAPAVNGEPEAPSPARSPDRASDRGSDTASGRAPAKKPKAAAPRPRKKASKSEADLPPSRQGKVQLTQWVDPIDKQRIDLIVALNLADNKADFIKKAIDLFIEKHGKLPI